MTISFTPEFKHYTLHKLAESFGRIGTIALRDNLLYFEPLHGEPILIAKPDDPLEDSEEFKKLKQTVYAYEMDNNRLKLVESGLRNEVALLRAGFKFSPREATPDLGDYNWTNAVSCASWNPAQVAEVIASSEGENDGANWLLVVKLADGRYSFLSAGCDYTGWDCQAGGHSEERDSLAELVRFGMGQDDRERLGFELIEAGA